MQQQQQLFLKPAEEASTHTAPEEGNVVLA
jgi:hypothetical protein